MFRTPLMLALALGSGASAKTLNIATDIGPVHSLVSSVAGDRQDVSLIVPQNADLHHFSLLPKQAAELQSSDIVFYVGGSLLAWFEETVQTLSPDAMIVALDELDGFKALEMREEAAMGHDHHGSDEHDDDHDEHDDDHDDDHDDHHDAHDDDKHDDHDDDKHDDHAEDDHDDHKEEDHTDEAHDDDHGQDPHLWLDADTALMVVAHVAQVLSAEDPENADYYGGNAARLTAEISQWRADTIDRFKDAKSVPFLVGHDAFQYFERLLGVAPSGFITDALGAEPTIQNMRELTESNAKCILADENEQNPHSTTIAEHIGAKIVTANPVGNDQELGPNLYMAMMKRLSDDFANCLGVK